MSPAPPPIERLLSEHAPLVWMWAASRRSAGAASADDLAQEVLLRALQLGERFEGPAADFRRWLFAIADRVRLEHGRERLRPDRGAALTSRLARVPAVVTSISSRVARDERHALLCEQIRELPAKERDLLSLRGLHGLAWSEIQAELGSTEVALRQRYSRLLRRLREAPGWPEGVREA